MTSDSPRGSPKMATLPRSLSSIVVSVVGLAMFLIFASLLLVSYPISSTVRGYFYSLDRKVVVTISPVNQSTVENLFSKNVDGIHKSPSSGSDLEVPMSSNNDKNAILTDNSPSDGIQVSISSSGSESSLKGKSTRSKGEEETSANSASISATSSVSVQSRNIQLVTFV
ncbi:hypothetical protein SLEP1_g42176 [Rubroshorea leprosula]|uniref:Uncharacterized protein n=1 Tax=Rubroshorea leprosula TaxID=152421 RepID=A0AAV5L9E9_9ROSI|nr:hypothetical protein SLEP1_g42176 [Rubroshorea leprosula]